MKILNISPVMPLLWNMGGTVVTAYKSVKAICRQGHEVFTLTTNARRNSDQVFPISQDSTWEGLQLRCNKMIGPAPPFWSPELRREVRRRSSHFEIALIRSAWTYVGVAAGRECRKALLPYLAYPEGSFDPYAMQYSRSKKKIWWRLWERAHFQQAAAIVALTRSERQSIRQMGLTNRIEIIPNGVSLSDLEDGLKRPELEDRWEELRSRRWLLFLGRLHSIKGLDLLIPAFARITQQFPDVLLVLAGPDERGYVQSVHQMIRAAGVTDRVLLTGPVYGGEKNGLLRNAEAVVLTSHSEGFPMAILEAMGLGVPVLITEACNVPEVAEAEAGLVVAPQVVAISQAMTMLLEDESARQTMGRNARNLVEEKFTWDRVAQQTLALCQDIL